MSEKIIQLDHSGRNLIVRGPEERVYRGEGRFCWVFLVDEAEFRENNEQPFEFCAIFADRTPEEIAKTPRHPLYSIVSSSWLDESWTREIEPQIVAFVKESS